MLKQFELSLNLVRELEAEKQAVDLEATEIRTRTTGWVAHHIPYSSWSATASQRLGCFIWAEFVQTRVGCSEDTEIFCLTKNDQFYSRTNQLQTRHKDATLPPVSSRAPRPTPHKTVFGETNGLVNWPR